ncbi:MAG: choice-of-anchor D domain-containing protein [Candidatus Solibacter usitatus]|nr:choice-of-anchor D domain-containing protein [Candidatus Solibacter usitatus]
MLPLRSACALVAACTGVLLFSPRAAAQFDNYTATLDPNGSFWNATVGSQNCSGTPPFGIPNTPLGATTLTIPISVFYGSAAQCGKATGSWTITAPASPFNLQLQDRGAAPPQRFLASAPMPIQTSITMAYTQVTGGQPLTGVVNYWVRGITEQPGRDSCSIYSTTHASTQSHSQTCNPTLFPRMASFDVTEKPDIIFGGILMQGLSTIQALVIHLTLIPNGDVGTLRYDVFLRYNLTAAAPPPPPPSLSVDHIEVVQVVQNAANDAVPLIAKKSTVVRVFPKVTNAPFVENITGTLRGFKDGTALQSFSPLSPFNGPITAKANPNRNSEFDSLDFLLPIGWTDAGEFQVAASLQGPNGLSAQGQLRAPVRFQMPSKDWPYPLFIGSVLVCLQGPDDARPKCPHDSVRFRSEFLQKLYPLPDDGIWYYPLLIPPLIWTKPLASGEDIEALKAELNRVFQFATVSKAGGAVPRLDQLVGWVPVLPGVSILGSSDPVWGGGQGHVVFIQDTQEAAGADRVIDFLDASNSLAHEIGHNLGLQHPLAAGADGVPQLVPGACGAVGLIPDWPYPDGGSQETGYDPEARRLIPASKLDPATKHFLPFDLMTYCSPLGRDTWITPFQYNNLVSLRGAKGVYPLPPPIGPGISVSGSVTNDGGSATLLPAFETAGFASYTPSDPQGDYCVQLVTAAGVFATNCFPLSFKDPETGSGLLRQSFSVMMPTSDDITRIVVRRKGAEIGSLSAGLGRPSIDITSPAPGASLPGGSLTLTWSGFDPDNDPVWYMVQYSPGDDNPFYPLADGLTGTSYTTDTRTVANGRQFSFRVLASDGIHTSFATLNDVRITQNAVLAVSPAKADFGDIVMGQVGQLSITVSNSGDGMGAIKSVSSDSPMFPATFNGTRTMVPAGGSVSIPVSFRPDSLGSKTAALTIVGSDADREAMLVPLSGRGVATAAPNLQVSPAVLGFGNVDVSRPATLTLALLNVGNARVLGTSITSSGAPFTVVSPAGSFVIEPHAAIEAQVRFAPTSNGAASGQLTIASNDPTNPTTRVNLTGTGTGGISGPTISLPTAPVDYGSVTVGQTKSIDVAIRNTGAANLTVSAITSSDSQFTIAQTLPQTITVGAQLTVAVIFRPTGAGTRTAALTITSNDAARPTATVSLTGVGVAAAVTYSLNRFEVRRTFLNDGLLPWTIAPVQQTAPAAQRAFPFGWNFKWPDNNTGPNINQTSATVTFTQLPATVTSGTSAPLATTMAGDWNTSGYGVDRDHTIRLAGDAGSGQASFTDAPSGTFHHEFTTSASPTAPQPDAAGEIAFNITATLRFGDDNTATMTVRVVYSASPPVTGPVVSVSPTALDFGSIAAGQRADKTLTLTNTGSSALTVNTLSATGVFSVVSPSAPLTVAAGASTTVTVRFSPLAAGAQTGTLTIAGSASTITVPLSGTATPAAAADIILRADSGRFDNAFGAATAMSNVYFTVRLTPPSYPATLKSVQVYFGNRMDGLYVGDPITIVAGANPAGTTTIDGVALQRTAAQVTRLGDFHTFAVTPLTIRGGDFVVGFVSANPAGSFPADLDDIPPSQRRSYVSANGQNFLLIDSISPGGNFGIRAVVSPQ